MDSLVFYYTADFFFGLVFSIVSLIILALNPDGFSVALLITSLFQLLISSSILAFSFYNDSSLGPFSLSKYEKKNIEINWGLGTCFKILGLFIGLVDEITDILYYINNDFASEDLKTACLFFIVLLPLIYLFINIYTGLNFALVD